MPLFSAFNTVEQCHHQPLIVVEGVDAAWFGFRLADDLLLIIDGVSAGIVAAQAPEVVHLSIRINKCPVCVGARC